MRAVEAEIVEEEAEEETEEMVVCTDLVTCFKGQPKWSIINGSQFYIHQQQQGDSASSKLPSQPVCSARKLSDNREKARNES